MDDPRAGVTQLLRAWSEGDQQALEQLTPLVYDELLGLIGPRVIVAGFDPASWNSGSGTARTRHGPGISAASKVVGRRTRVMKCLPRTSSADTRRAPFLFTPCEVKALVGAARALDPRGTQVPLVYPTLFGLLASTGLRISEALNLLRQDVTAEGLVVGFNVLHAGYNSLAGQDLTGLVVGRAGVNPFGPVAGATLKLTLSSQTTVAFANYGITDDFDLGVAVAWVRISLGAAESLFSSSGVDLTGGAQRRVAGAGDQMERSRKRPHYRQRSHGRRKCRPASQHDPRAGVRLDVPTEVRARRSPPSRVPGTRGATGAWAPSRETRR
jgi:hypothetical protein